MQDRWANLLADLDDPRFAQAAIHRGLEEAERSGVRVVRFERTPETVLSWIDAEFGGSWSSEANAGGVWIAEDAQGPAGFAAFDPRGLPFHWLRAWAGREGVGIFGPFGVAPRARKRGVGPLLLHAALFALRERGYRQALIPAVGGDKLAAYYERHAAARVVESVDLPRRGRRYRTTILASGNGTNFAAVAVAAAAGTLPLEVRALVVNRAKAYAVKRAESAGVRVRALVWDRAGESRETYDATLLEAVEATAPELVLLLGWMHVLAPSFVARFPQLLNLHPAFLPLDSSLDFVTMPDGSVIPAYRGAHAVDDALADGVAWIGASVHRVNPAIDRGEILARAPLRLQPDEARDGLEGRLHELERAVLASAIARWSFERP